MEKLIKVEFDKTVIPFIMEMLTSAESISELLTSNINKKMTKVWGYLPYTLKETNITNFNEGGVYLDNPINEYVNFIKGMLEKKSEYSWIIIDNCSNTDESLEMISIDKITKVFFYGETVLHYLPNSLYNAPNIKTTVESGGWYPFIGLITKINDVIFDQIETNIVTYDSMKFMVEKATVLIIGAFDEEGYLIVELQQLF